MIAPFRLITCIIPSGRALEVLERLRGEHGIPSAFAHHAREVTLHTLDGEIADESEVITVLAAPDQAEAVFSLLCDLAVDEAGDPTLGPALVWMERSLRAAASPPPEVPAEPAPG